MTWNDGGKANPHIVDLALSTWALSTYTQIPPTHYFRLSERYLAQGTPKAPKKTHTLNNFSGCEICKRACCVFSMVIVIRGHEPLGCSAYPRAYIWNSPAVKPNTNGAPNPSYGVEWKSVTWPRLWRRQSLPPAPPAGAEAVKLNPHIVDGFSLTCIRDAVEQKWKSLKNISMMKKKWKTKMKK